MANLKNINEVPAITELLGDEYIPVVKDGTLHKILKTDTKFGDEALYGIGIIKSDTNGELEALALIGYDSYYADGYYIDEIKSSKQLETIISDEELKSAYKKGTDVVIELYKENDSTKLLELVRKYKTMLQLSASSEGAITYSSCEFYNGGKIVTTFASKENVGSLLA